MNYDGGETSRGGPGYCIHWEKQSKETGQSPANCRGWGPCGKKNLQGMLTIRHHVLPLAPRSDMIRPSTARRGCFSPPTSPPLMRRPSLRRTVYARVLKTSRRPGNGGEGGLVVGVPLTATRLGASGRIRTAGFRLPSAKRGLGSELQFSQHIRKINQRELGGRKSPQFTKTNAQDHCP